MNKKKLIIFIFLILHIIIITNGIDIANATNLPFKISLREHKIYAAYDPVYTFSKPSGSLLRMDTSFAGLGAGYVFFTATRAWLNGKYIRFRWDGTFTTTLGATVKIYDGEYVESSDTDFPSGSTLLIKGSGLLQTLVTKSGTFAVETQDVLISVAGTENKCTVMFSIIDSWQDRTGYINIDWIEINGASGGSDNKYIQPMDNSVSMGRSNGYGDYGTLGSGVVVGPFLSVSYTTNGLVYRSETLITNNSILDIGGDIQLEALSASNCTFIRWLINGTSVTLNPKTITVLYNTTVWCYFGTIPTLSGNAIASDVKNGKTFYNNDISNKITGTLTLEGNATTMDVLWGQTFYSNSFIRQTGEYVAMPPFDFEGNATEIYVFQGYMFYNNGTEPRYGAYIETQDTFPIGIGAGIIIGLIVGMIIGKRD